MKFKFGLSQIKSKTPFVMRGLGTALGAGGTIFATIDVVGNRVKGATIAAVIAIVGKFITEMFGEPTTVEGTLHGQEVQITQPLTPPEKPALEVKTLTASEPEAL